MDEDNQRIDYGPIGSKIKTTTTILSNLTLNDCTEKEKQQQQEDEDQKKNSSSLIPCVQCDQYYNYPEAKDDYLAHLFLEHRLVIADVDDIGNLKEYLLYWAKELRKGHELQEFCTTMLLDQLPDGTPSTNERYYLLSDILPQDYELRKQLHTKRLENVLKQYQFERSDRTFSRECLYCRDIITGLRSEYIEHLYTKHFLQLGKSENLVFVDELLDCVQIKLENLICIFCEKIFKDRATLKEHMRKKGHKRINPDIKFYDKFYLENYKIEKPKHVKNMKRNTNRNRQQQQQSNNHQLQQKQNKDLRTQHKLQNILFESKQQQNEHNSEIYDINDDENCFNINSGDENDSDWSDWDDVNEKIQLVCLFCKYKTHELNYLKNHMINEHEFDFDLQTKSLTFYQKIKIINYIRRQIHILQCVVCNGKYRTLNELQQHLKDEQHFGIGDKKQWDRPEYFFPTYEDDGLLCQLDDIEDDLNNKNYENIDDGQTSVVIISEDIKASRNRDAEALSMENFII